MLIILISSIFIGLPYIITASNGKSEPKAKTSNETTQKNHSIDYNEEIVSEQNQGNLRSTGETDELENKIIKQEAESSVIESNLMVNDSFAQPNVIALLNSESFFSQIDSLEANSKNYEANLAKKNKFLESVQVHKEYQDGNVWIQQFNCGDRLCAGSFRASTKDAWENLNSTITDNTTKIYQEIILDDGSYEFRIIVSKTINSITAQN